MFRRRIYAQGFTILAMVGGSVYWESDRQKRNEFNELIEDKKKKEKHEAWLKELEARQQEEDELRRIRNKMIDSRVAEKRSEKERREMEASFREEAGQNKGGLGNIRSALEAGEGRRDGPVLSAVRRLWEQK